MEKVYWVAIGMVLYMVSMAWFDMLDMATNSIGGFILFIVMGLMFGGLIWFLVALVLDKD